MINSPSPRPVCHQVFPTLPSKYTLNSVIPSHSLIQAFTTLSVCHDKKPLPFSHILTFQAISTERLPFSSYYSLAQEFLTLCCFWSKQILSLHSEDWLGNANLLLSKTKWVAELNCNQTFYTRPQQNVQLREGFGKCQVTLPQFRPLLQLKRV